MTDSQSDEAKAAGAKTEPAAKRAFEDLPAPAQRALREAEARRAKLTEKTDALPKEVGGRGGKDPARFDDWEINGIAVDF